MINDLKDIDRLIDLLIFYKMPKEQNLYVTVLQKAIIDRFLKNLGSSGVSRCKVGETDAFADRFAYKGFTFNIIEF